MKRPLILVTNDDGVLAPGIADLAAAVAPLGEVVVCAPETERSGASQAITLHSHLRATHVRERWWAVNGTPVDCVYLAILHLCDRRPDLVISGINPGFNLGTDVFYSGTVGGAAEGFLRGSPAIAISVPHGQPTTIAVPWARRLAAQVLARGERVLLNVNLPEVVHPHEIELPLADEELHRRAAALRPVLTRLGRRDYQEYVEERTDLRGRPYFWIGGPPEETPNQEGQDTWAVAQGMVAIAPLVLDISAPDLEPYGHLVADGDPTGGEP
ncbi:MAG: 5'/3'-nucleotidase SurE [Myxococcales bacterium]|nr:5'/3'-nucleotidase SurE [Myxococcales bacterium]MCB9566244.1 5'/3'-nucleotidase SurE [Myxococcales bacterium]MCB9702698.1 5'/3'-nucleotidase SurE [Myxococcales bacterium]